MNFPAIFRLKSFILIHTLFIFITTASLADSYPDFEEITAEVRASVVNIRNTPKHKSQPKVKTFENNEILNKFFKSGNKIKDVLGSGFFISSDGYIITEYSVIKNARKVVVSLDNGKKIPAKVVGYDKTSSVALLKVKGNDYPALTPGDSSKLKAGQWVMAIGSPFGMENIVTIGVVSSVDTSKNKYKSTGSIVNNVTINPGNGGGPLINGDNEVVGMNAVIYSRTGSFNGLSFAIPINDILPVVEKLKKN